MKKIPKFILGSAFAVLAVGALVTAPLAAGPETTQPTKRPFARGDRMVGRFGGAPLITIALNHKSELNLTADQVAKLEQIKSHYQAQVTPLSQQLQTIDKDIAGLMQQTPANLIQVKASFRTALFTARSSRERPFRAFGAAARSAKNTSSLSSREFPRPARPAVVNH